MVEQGILIFNVFLKILLIGKIKFDMSKTLVLSELSEVEEIFV